MIESSFCQFFIALISSGVVFSLGTIALFRAIIISGTGILIGVGAKFNPFDNIMTGDIVRIASTSSNTFIQSRPNVCLNIFSDYFTTCSIGDSDK